MRWGSSPRPQQGSGRQINRLTNDHTPTSTGPAILAIQARDEEERKRERSAVGCTLSAYYLSYYVILHAYPSTLLYNVGRLSGICSLVHSFRMFYIQSRQGRVRDVCHGVSMDAHSTPAPPIHRNVAVSHSTLINLLTVSMASSLTDIYQCTQLAMYHNNIDRSLNI